jgi:magnesium chelatase subunit D
VAEAAQPSETSVSWDDAALAAALLAVDPMGLGGAAVRAGAGPARDAWLGLLRALLPEGTPIRRAPSHIGDERLIGGLDLPASLAAGRPVAQRGLLAECDGGVVVLPMAERIEAAAAARLCAALDAGEVALERDGLALRLPAQFAVVALDESQMDEPPPPAALLERLAFLIDLSRVGARQPFHGPVDRPAVIRARQVITAIAPPGEGVVEALCAAAAMMGLDSARTPLLALRAARAHAALAGRAAIGEADAAAAARLVLAPRALTAPGADADETLPEDAVQEDAAPEEASPDRTPPPASKAPSEPPPETSPPAPGEPSPTDRIVSAIRAALPADLLERLDPGAAARSAAARGGARARAAGARTKAAARGRPAGVRQGRPRRGERINLVETLRAATPWQKLRGGGPSAGGQVEGGGRVQVRAEDFRLHRFVQRSQSTTIVVVDASGSAAFQRLAEAKGAVELLLARAYVSRARVALIAFRGSAADLLLPPTRSLTRAKRRLADLPGGGGTPLAAGVDMALALARAEQAQERTPILVFLTDGRANIGRDGGPGRPAAEADALDASTRVRMAGVSAAWLDTSPRPRPGGDRFARAMGAAYTPLPYADAQSVTAIVEDLRSGAR